jgi:hypothetical protein
MTKTIIAGSRDCTDYSQLIQAVAECGWEITSVVSGIARGADTLGIMYAHNNSLLLDKYPADWNKYGKSAGPGRNAKMAENAEALIALWDGKSKGTKHMIDTATSKGLKVYVFMLV